MRCRDVGGASWCKQMVVGVQLYRFSSDVVWAESEVHISCMMSRGEVVFMNLFRVVVEK